MDDYALVKCRICGEFVQVAPELLGDKSASEITDYVCGACEEDTVHDAPLDDDFYDDLDEDGDY